MVVVSQLMDNNKIHYEIGQVDNFNDLLYWLQHYEGEPDFSLSIGGYLFHFRTHEERFQFAFGFQAAWNLIDDNYLNLNGGK